MTEQQPDPIEVEANGLTVGKIIDAPPLEPDLPPLQERVAAMVEDLRVRWFMLDAQSKQALVLMGLYLGYALIDVAAALVKTTRGGGE